MSIKLWGIIANLHTGLTTLRNNPSPTALDLVELRSHLRAQLEQIRTLITEQYSERDAYYVLFPLTAHCDEGVKKGILDRSHLEWPPLQQELYQVVDAGDLFYELLDTVLAKTDTLSLLYEVYYFCLRDGFYGRYGVNPDRIADYIEKLQRHIALQPLAEATTTPLPVLKKWANLRLLKRVYYGGAILLLILFYCLLEFLASSWNPSFTL